MGVEVNSTRKAVEISWDVLSEGAPPETEKPPGFPTHPIFLPPYVDNELPDSGELPEIDNSLPPHVDNELPGDQPYPDQGLPGEQPKPDQGLPGEQPGVEQPIFLPPYIDNSLPGTVRAVIRAKYMAGNLPDYVAPHGGKVKAVQVFAQGQDGDWSNTAVQPNDGLAVLTYPESFTGESYVEIREAITGTLVDSGTITVE